MSPSPARLLAIDIDQAIDARAPMSASVFRERLAPLLQDPHHAPLDLYPLWRPALRSPGLALLEALIEAGAPLDEAPGELMTPLGLAVTHALRRGKADPCRLLLACGADPNAPIARGGSPCLSRVLSATIAPPSLAAALLEAGADPNWTDQPGGMTYLHFAVNHGCAATAAALLAAGADPESQASRGLAPLDLAIALGHEDCAVVIRSFLQAQALRACLPPAAAAPRPSL